MSAIPQLVAEKHEHLTQLELKRFNANLHADMIAVSDDEGVSLTEFVKKSMREIIPRRPGGLTTCDDPNLVRVHLTGFPVDLKKDMIAYAEMEGISLGELVKRCMLIVLPRRVAQLGFSYKSEYTYSIFR